MNYCAFAFALLLSLAMPTYAVEPNWIVVNEFGQSKVYVDSASIESIGPKARATVKYVLVPHGTDKRNGRAVKEMLMLEEYDTASSRFRVHQIVFTYSDGEVTQPLETDRAWKPATGGNEKTLEYIRQRLPR